MWFLLGLKSFNRTRLIGHAHAVRTAHQVDGGCKACEDHIAKRAEQPGDKEPRSFKSRSTLGAPRAVHTFASSRPLGATRMPQCRPELPHVQHGLVCPSSNVPATTPHAKSALPRRVSRADSLGLSATAARRRETVKGIPGRVRHIYCTE